MKNTETSTSSSDESSTRGSSQVRSSHQRKPDAPNAKRSTSPKRMRQKGERQEVSGPKVAVVIPNWNGANELRPSLDSLLAQSLKPHIIVVDNGSIDDSVEIIEKEYPSVELIRHDTNKGYAGGVNPGFRRAIEREDDYVAPFNNDAIADQNWLKLLVNALESRPQYGIATCKILSSDGKHLDSTGDYYTTWGLPYPRGRDEVDSGQYDNRHDDPAPNQATDLTSTSQATRESYSEPSTNQASASQAGPDDHTSSLEVFGASGGASLYRVALLKEIGLLDEDFFAYYEDVDISFRAQLAGWKILYVPEARVYHATSTTGRRIKGFFTEQTMKNLPMLLWKNVPRAYLPTVLPRFALVYAMFFASALQRGQLQYALRGAWRAFTLWPKKHRERRAIQSNRKTDDTYIGSILTYDLPPNAAKLRKLRALWHKLKGSR